MLKLTRYAVAAPNPQKISRLRCSVRGSVLVASALLVLSALPARAETPTLVSTRDGPFQGMMHDGAATFLGIPYAAPPVGPLRWRPPAPHKAWRANFQAVTAPKPCAQVKTLGVFAGPRNANEDCLYLNVFTPTKVSLPKPNLPVIVWLHGGGNFDGSITGYDGSKLARMGDTIVVTVQYRLNLMGYLAVPALDREGHPFGNYGLMDQQFALRWVHDNIAAFGGDPDNMILAGQSAGAYDTELAMVSPTVMGTFQHAIFQSGCSTALVLPSLSSAEKTGADFAKAAGCGTGSDAAVARCLRALPASKVEALAEGPADGSQFVIGPMVDGTIVTAQPVDAFASGKFAHIPMMNGVVADEQNFFLAVLQYTAPTRSPVTTGQYRGSVRAIYAPPVYKASTAQGVLQRYSPLRLGNAQKAWNRAGSDGISCGVRHFNELVARRIPLYTYEFVDRNVPSYFPKMKDFAPGAFHTSDIQYLFPLWHGGPKGIPHPLNAAQTALSDRLVRAWSNFARYGDPNGEKKTPLASLHRRPKGPMVLSINTRTGEPL